MRPHFDQIIIRINIHEAKTHLSRYLERLIRGGNHYFM